MSQKPTDQKFREFGGTNLNNNCIPRAALRPNQPNGYPGYAPFMDGQFSNVGGVILDPNLMGNGLNMMPVNLGQLMATQGNTDQRAGQQKLLSPDHFIQTMSSSQTSETPISVHGVNGGAHSALLNMDIPSSDFMNTINFGAIVGANTGNDGHEEGDDMEEGDDDVYLEDAEENMMEQSLESVGDMLEQKQAVEQARLMDKFKKLRDIQMHQQQLLMQQQQEQLLMLRSEQERVQRMIAKQREQQWGGMPSNGQIAPGMMMGQLPQYSMPNVSPPKGRPPTHPRSQSSLPQAIASSTLALARMNAGMEPPKQSTPTRNKKGRPVPNLKQPDRTPTEFRENGNPDLNSDTGTMDSRSMEDGVCPLPDTASETSEQTHYTRDNQQDSNSDKENVVPKPRVKQDDSLRRTLFTGSNSTLDSEGDNIDSATHFAQSHQNGRLQQPPAVTGQETVGRSDHNHGVKSQNQVLDFRESEGQEEEIDEEYEEGSEEEDQQEEEEEEEEGNETMAENPEPPSPENFDDIPVAGSKKKTFEELLEEELRKEEERLREGSSEPHRTNGSLGRKAFLKRGEGVARYGIKSSSGGKKRKAYTSLSKVASETPTSRHVSAKKIEKPKEVPKTLSMKTSPPRQGLQLKRPPKIPQAKRPLDKQNAKLKNTSTMSKGAGANSKVGSVAGGRTVSGDNRVPSSKTEEISDPPGPQDSVGDVSFQNCMQERQVHEEVEKGELDEFELLEQYADDNASFLSNLSAVNRVVQREKQPKPQNRAPSPEDPECTEADATDLADNTLHEEDDTLACSSSESSEEPGTEQEGEDDEDDDKARVQNVSAPNSKLVSEQSSETLTDKPQVRGLQSLRTMHRKIVSLDSRTPTNEGHVHLTNVEQFSEEESEDESEDGSSSEDENTYSNGAHTTKGVMTHTRHNQYSNNELHTEGLSQPVDSLGASRHGDSHHGSSHVDSQHGFSQVDSHHGPNYVESHNGSSHADPNQGSSHLDSGHITSHRNTHSQHGQSTGVPPQEVLEFGDEEEWGDQSQVEEEEEDLVKKILNKGQGHQNQAFVKTKVESGRREEENVASPPTSKLVSKLFPNLKPEKAKPQLQPEQEQKFAAVKTSDIGDGVQSKVMREKLAELEREIERFRSENATLAKLRKEREEGLEHIKKEMTEFEKQKNQELKRIQEYKSEEMKKLKKEKKVFEQYQKAARAMPDRKEREEIENLKEQLSELQEEMKRKEQRWTASTTRMRDRTEQLETENRELKEEVKMAERKRLEQWNSRAQASKANKGAKTTAFKPLKDTNPVISKTQNSNKEQSNGVLPGTSRLPRPEQQPRPQTEGLQTELLSDNPLKQSTNLDLDASIDFLDEHEADGAEESARSPSKFPKPLGASRRMSSPKPPESPESPAHLTASSGPGLGMAPRPTPSENPTQGNSKPIPRKKAVTLGISSGVDKGDEKYEEVQHQDGKIERFYSNGAREILFSNGTRKQVSADGQSIIVSFFNGDIKQILPDQRVVYYYADAQTTHTTYPDGLEILQFPNAQNEKHYPDGTKEITFPDQTIKYLFPSGLEESIFPDGTVIRVEKSGEKVMEFPNGQREVHTTQYKRREYPDGTVKTVYPDGRQETRYSSGRIRVKDHQGNVIVDRRVQQEPNR